ncbi:LSM11 protein, partial [Atractosteus spatula]|nr:LSM11 protein [Atractosteus spatula]
MEESERKVTDRCSATEKRGDIMNPSSLQDPDEEQGEEPEDDQKVKLDVSSDKFDPLLALYCPEISLPYPNVRCFNNIAQYESFLRGGSGRAKPQNVAKKNKKAKKGVPDPERIERLKKLMVNAPTEEGAGGRQRPPRKTRAPKNVLTRMAVHAGSPLGELYRCVQEKIRVKVHIRTFKGLRGVCSGFLVAFDKFWNMALVDVDETYRKPLLGEAFHHERALTVTRLFDRLKLQESPDFGTPEEKRGGDPPRTQETRTAGEPPPAGEHTAGRQLRRSPRKKACGDPGKEREGPGPGGAQDTAPGHCPRTEPESGTQGGGRHPKPRVDYQHVHRRHVNQLFIRGENILLVNLEQ